MRDLLRKKGIGMSKSLGFSDTYALAMTRSRAAQLGLSKISDLKRLPELQLALTHEFLDRGDGWPALKRRYDLQQRNVVGVDHDVAYRQLLAGEVDIIDVYSTDAMIRRGDLVLLKDDVAFFPRYDAVWLYRLDAASRYPELPAAMHRLDGTVSEATMQSLNDEVEAGRKTEIAGGRRFSHAATRAARRRANDVANSDDREAHPGTPRPGAAVALAGNRRRHRAGHSVPAESPHRPSGVGRRRLAANDSFARPAGAAACRWWRRSAIAASAKVR